MVALCCAKRQWTNIEIKLHRIYDWQIIFIKYCALFSGRIQLCSLIDVSLQEKAVHIMVALLCTKYQWTNIEIKLHRIYDFRIIWMLKQACQCWSFLKGELMHKYGRHYNPIVEIARLCFCFCTWCMRFCCCQSKSVKTAVLKDCKRMSMSCTIFRVVTKSSRARWAHHSKFFSGW